MIEAVKNIFREENNMVELDAPVSHHKRDMSLSTVTGMLFHYRGGVSLSTTVTLLFAFWTSQQERRVFAAVTYLHGYVQRCVPTVTLTVISGLEESPKEACLDGYTLMIWTNDHR